MGNSDSKLNFRKAVVQLTNTNEQMDEMFWDQLWTEGVASVQDLFALMPASDVRTLRDDAAANLATLCYKAVEKLASAADSLLQVDSPREQHVVLNCVRLLTRLVPYIFEDPDWRGFFWSSLPVQGSSSCVQEDSQVAGHGEERQISLAHTLLSSLCDLLFCPDFTVQSSARSNSASLSGPDGPEEVTDSCELIWEPGVGCAQAATRSARHDSARAEILKLLLTLFSDIMYHHQQLQQQLNDARLTDETAANSNASSGDRQSADYVAENRWLDIFTSSENRHALPLFTSLLNTVCGYHPDSSLMPLNHLLFEDSREPLVEVALQVLIVSLDHVASENLFVNYLSRIHRDNDLNFILKGFTRLLNNPLQSSYFPTKKIQFHQELLVLFWKTCDHNRKFLFYVLKSSEVLNILVPTLYHLNEARADQSRVGLVHIGVFILLLLSGERNFGVRLNKPYSGSIPMDVPVFNGTHADLLILVFHRMITTGHSRLQPLFDCLLTIIVNVSPYLKSLSMTASTKLLHLLEAFSTPWFLYSNPNNHHLVFFLLEAFNNIIQYQFDGNSNLIYTIIRKRNIFHTLANLPVDGSTIQRSASSSGRWRASLVHSGSNPDSNAVKSNRRERNEEMHSDADSQRDDVNSRRYQASSGNQDDVGSAVCAQTVDEPENSRQVATLAATPRIEKMTEQEEAHRINHEEPAATSGRGSEQLSPHLVEASHSDLTPCSEWRPTSEWALSWRQKLPLQTIMRLLQVLVPQVEKICIDKGLTDEWEILKFLRHGTLVGLLPVPHPILIRKYQANAGTALWFRTYMWGVIYLRNTDPPIWYDTHVQLFQIHTL